MFEINSKSKEFSLSDKPHSILENETPTPTTLSGRMLYAHQASLRWVEWRLDALPDPSFAVHVLAHFAHGNHSRRAPGSWISLWWNGAAHLSAHSDLYLRHTLSAVSAKLLRFTYLQPNLRHICHLCFVGTETPTTTASSTTSPHRQFLVIPYLLRPLNIHVHHDQSDLRGCLRKSALSAVRGEHYPDTPLLRKSH